MVFELMVLKTFYISFGIPTMFLILNPIISVPYGSNAIDFLGNPVILTDNGDSLSFQVNIDNSPVYVHCTDCTTSLKSVFLPFLIK